MAPEELIGKFDFTRFIIEASNLNTISSVQGIVFFIILLGLLTMAFIGSFGYIAYDDFIE